MMRTLLLFDGIGGNTESVVAALRKLYARPENLAYFHVVLTALDDALDHVGTAVRDAVLPVGLPLRRWLDTSADLPPDAARSSIVAGVCVHAYQVCHLQPTRRSHHEVAALGHSIGLQAAIVAGMRLRRMDEFLALVARSVTLVALSLVRGQELAAGADTSPELAERYLARVDPGRAPGPMASLTGMPRHELRGAVDRYNRDGGGSLSLGLVNSPTVGVLTGSTADLLGFYFAHESDFERTRARWAFLPMTIPFHSSRLAPAARRVRDDLELLGPMPAPDDLALPVYATDAPRNLQDSDDLVGEFLDQVLVRPIEWELAVGHAVRDSRIERIVDYGPGPAVRRFTRECLPDRAHDLRFESVQQFTRRAG